MAGNAVIGALRIVLGADSAALEKGLKDARGKLASFSAGVAKAGAVAAAGFAAAGVAVGVAVKGVIDEADKLGKMGQKFGVPVEQLSALKYAADLSDVSLDALGKGLGKLSKNMVEAAANPTSEAARAFNALGVSVKNSDGTLKGSSQVLTDVAGKFEGLKDGAGKTAVSMALFGKAGADLIPLLNSGKTGIEELTAEARQLGIVIDSQTAKSAEAFNDNLKRLGAVKDGIIVKITAGMVPALQNLSANMVRVAKDSDAMKSIGAAIGETFAWLFNVTERLGLAWQRLGIEWEAFKKLFTAVPFTAASTKALADFQAAGQETQRVLANLDIVQQTAHLADAFGIVAPKAKQAAEGQKEFNYAAMAGKNALEQFVDAQTKAVAGQTAELATIGMAAGAKERLKIALQAATIEQTNQIPVTEALRLKVFELGAAAEQTALKIAGANLVQAAIEPHEAYRMEIANNMAALTAFGATTEQIAAVQQRTAEKFGNTWGQVGESVAGSIKKIGEAFGKESKEMAMVAKVAGIIQSTISMFTGAAKALELPFPANLAAMASVLATGAGIVAQIKSTAVTGFATGGLVMGPGTSMSDSIPAMLSRGEFVVNAEATQRNRGLLEDINAGGRSSRGGVEIVRLVTDEISTPFAEKIVSALNRVMRDGVKLEVVPA